jgi:transposase
MAQVARHEGKGTASKLYVAFELSEKSWKLIFSDGERTSEAGVHARDLPRVLDLIKNARRRFGTGAKGKVLSCYEAGRDGFWLHRALLDNGIENTVLDASSIEVDRRARRAKTDRLDGRKLVALLIRLDHGDAAVRRVNVPSPQVEDARRISREMQRLKNERTAHTNRIHGLLSLVGRSVNHLKHLRTLLDAGWCGADGRPVGPVLRQEILRELSRIDLVNAQLLQVKRAQHELMKADAPCAEVAARLARVVSVGETSATILSYELFGWRDLENRRQVASAAGLTPTPYSSGNEEREQGVSKAGNARVRWVAVQLAWSWLRLQPRSRLTRWYWERFGHAGPRFRKIGIVALARRLLVDLWRYLKSGTIPEGALMRA